jgi:hypothetical protein
MEFARYEHETEHLRAKLREREANRDQQVNTGKKIVILNEECFISIKLHFLQLSLRIKYSVVFLTIGLLLFLESHILFGNQNLNSLVHYSIKLFGY